MAERNWPTATLYFREILFHNPFATICLLCCWPWHFMFFSNPGINKVIRNECGTAQQSDTSRKHSGETTNTQQIPNEEQQNGGRATADSCVTKELFLLGAQLLLLLLFLLLLLLGVVINISECERKHNREEEERRKNKTEEEWWAGGYKTITPNSSWLYTVDFVFSFLFFLGSKVCLFSSVTSSGIRIDPLHTDTL